MPQALYQDGINLFSVDDTHMYVIEHVRMEISKSPLLRLRDSMPDTMRATAQT